MENINNIQKWVDVLRSGEYEQGTGHLCKDDKFCCLGVACEVYQSEFGDLRINTQHGMKHYDNDSGMLPKKVRDWLGVPDDDILSNVKTDDVYDRLLSYIELNDEKKYTFKQIADELEKQFLNN